MWKADGCVDVAKRWLCQENLRLKLGKDPGNFYDKYVCVAKSLHFSFPFFQLFYTTHTFHNLIKKIILAHMNSRAPCVSVGRWTEKMEYSVPVSQVGAVNVAMGRDK